MVPVNFCVFAVSQCDNNVLQCKDFQIPGGPYLSPSLSLLFFFYVINASALVLRPDRSLRFQPLPLRIRPVGQCDGSFSMSPLSRDLHTSLCWASSFVSPTSLRSFSICPCQFFLGPPLAARPSTCSLVISLIHPSLRRTCPNHRKRLFLSVETRLGRFSFFSRVLVPILSPVLTPHIQHKCAPAFIFCL